MDILAAALGGVYFAAALILAAYSGSFFVLLVIYLRNREHAPEAPQVSDDDLLSITLQLPVYNEQHVIDRLIDAIGVLDYPRDKLHVQILDDSTDSTTGIVRRKAAEWRAKGLRIDLLRRPGREGYKAGALAYGLARTTSDCVGVFDADFVPPPDFLRRVMPHFNARPDIALVQARLTHLNMDYNWLTRAQALAIDQHFAIEQVARSRGGLPMSMNGTGGIWRRDVLSDAGNWSSDTLTEDLDLSYRAFLKGWRFRYVVDVAVPGEVPPHLTAYKVQQARWAKGSTQCLKKHALPLLRSDLSPLQKFMGLLHLGQYAVQPLILLLFVLTPVLILTNTLTRLPLGPLGIMGIAPVAVLTLGQIELHDNWARRALYFPVLLLVTTGLLFSNSRAVIEALTGTGDNVFKRTPKFRVVRRGDTIIEQRYAIRPDWTVAGELLLGLYALAGLIVTIARFPQMVMYMAMYVLSFGSLAVWSLWQTWRLFHRAGTQHP